MRGWTRVVLAVAASGLGLSPTFAAAPSFDAGAAARAYWSRILVHCGDDYYRYYAQSEIVDYQAPLTLTLEVGRLTPADRAHQLQWKGRSTITAKMYRTRGANNNLQTLGDWSVWTEAGDESVAITVYNGQVLYDGVGIEQVHEAISCSEALAPTAPELLPKPPKSAQPAPSK